MSHCIGFLALLLTLSTAVSSAAHDGHLNTAPFDACNDRSLNTACAFSDSHRSTYRGTCQLVAEEALMCIRNQPIEYEETSVTPQ